jgi:FkbM family methyltransferase
MQRLKALLHGALRRLISMPLCLAPARTRAEIVAGFSERMFTDVAVEGRNLRFYTPTPGLLKRANDLLIKEPDMIGWLNGLPPGSVLWDIGANVGVFSLYAALLRETSVVAFEPSASNFYVLSRNIQINNLGNKITALCVAFSDCSKLGVLNMTSADMGAATSQFGQAGDQSPYWEKTITPIGQGMIGFTIDEFIDRFQPPFPNYLKIDVDGLEWPILQGAVQTLADSRLRSAMIELSVSHQNERKEAISFLNQCSLHLVSSGEIQSTASAKAANHLFERQ